MMATRSLEEKYDVLVTAIKANQVCKGQRQNLSLLRSQPIGKHIEPEIGKEAAISLIDCFHRIKLNPTEVDKRKGAVECLKAGGNCEKEISAYLAP